MRANLTFRLFLGGLGLGLFAACGTLSGPFTPEARTDTEKTQLFPPEGAGLWMAALRGLPPQSADRVKDALLATLEAEGIPASATNRNPASLRLDGEAERTETAPGTDHLVLRWTLRSTTGETIGTIEEAETLPAAVWESEPRHLEDMAGVAGRKLAKLARRGWTGQRVSTVAVRPVDGAPKDGQELLTRAVQAAIARAGVPVSFGEAEPSFVLLGEMRLGSARESRQRVEFVWTLIRPDGGAIGSFTQQNAIPEGQTTGTWGEIAPSIAAGTAEGVLALLEGLPRDRSENP